MTGRSITKRQYAMTDEDGSTSGGEDEKTIPFLRRLRDMLVENDETISFAPGVRQGDKVVMGRLIVHDRIKVEKDVLPRYFNHSSFASLRRQLNYFSFVRLGKGRQRGSIYINEAVVDIDDILHLKRRPAGMSAPDPGQVIAKANATFALEDWCESTGVSSSVKDSTHNKTKRGSDDNCNGSEMNATKRSKRRRIVNNNNNEKDCHKSDEAHVELDQIKNIIAYHNLVSDEDEFSDNKSHASTSNMSRSKERNADKELLEGCSALLALSERRWEM